MDEFHTKLCEKYKEGYIQGYEDAIKTVPQWIDAKVQLPEQSDEYYITWTGRLVKPFTGIGIAEYDKANDEWIMDDYTKPYKYVRVTAWMPLPKPFKGDVE